jgi:F-type H+-transporting ATPase subunit b
LHIEWTNLVIQIVAFLILYLLLQKFAFGPLFGIMEKRRQLVLNQVQTAENNRKQAEQILLEQKQLLADARKQAHEIVEQAKQTSLKQSDDIALLAHKESDRIKKEALKEIENEKNKAIAALRSQVGAMSVMIASKIIEKQMDEKTHKELIDNYLNKVGDQL